MNKTAVAGYGGILLGIAVSVLILVGTNQQDEYRVIGPYSGSKYALHRQDGSVVVAYEYDSAQYEVVGMAGDRHLILRRKVRP